MDRITSMETFVKVVEVGSFAAAARKLDISPAMATRHVHELEERLHARLLERTTRSLRLTQVGAIYLERCQRILRDLQETESVVSGEPWRPQGLLRVSSSGSFGVTQVAPILPEYSLRFPEVTVDLSINNRLVDLMSDDIDLAIRIGVLQDSNLIARKLCPVRLVLCAAPAYLERQGTPRKLADLAKHNCLTFTVSRGGTEWWFKGREGLISVPIAGSVRSDETYVLYRAALEGLGIVYATTYQVAPAVRSGKLKVLHLDAHGAELGAYAVYLSKKFVSAKIKTFVDFLADKLGANPDWDRWITQRPVKRAHAHEPA